MWEEPDCEVLKGDPRDLFTRKRQTEEHPSLIKYRGIPILRKGQKGFRVEAILPTRKKTKKTGLVNMDKARLHAGSPHVFLPVQAYRICTTVKRLLKGYEVNNTSSGSVKK